MTAKYYFSNIHKVQKRSEKCIIAIIVRSCENQLLYDKNTMTPTNHLNQLKLTTAGNIKEEIRSRERVLAAITMSSCARQDTLLYL